MPELRRDPLTDRWVIVADEPSPLPRAASARGLGSAAGCPLCPGKESLTAHELWTSRRAADGRWQTRVVPNRSPLLVVEGQIERRARGPYDWMSGIGAHEVIVESPLHDADLPDLSATEIETVLSAYRERIIDLKRDIRFQYLHVFRNRGAASGARTAHPCSQLLALPFIPSEVADELTQCRRHYDLRGRCLLCDVLDYELEGRSRVVAENRDVVAFCPYASRSIFEVWVMPRAHRASFEHSPHAELAHVAATLREALGRLRIALDDPAYYLTLHNSPVAAPDTPHYHWHIEIHPVLGVNHGLAAGSGTVWNPVAPELAARHLRELRWNG